MRGSGPSTASARARRAAAASPARTAARARSRSSSSGSAGPGTRRWSHGGGRSVGHPRYVQGMVTVDEVRALALTLPRTTEHLIHDRVKFRVGSIVYVAFSRDETTRGFG